jgi:hypothetical protein
MESVLPLLGLLSLLSFVASVICVPYLLNRLADDFFTFKNHQQRMRRRREQHPLMMVMIWITRHCAGVMLMAAGLIMLFVPGQGVLTILLALAIMDFPGKYKLIVLMVRQKRVRRALAWIRGKGGRQPFVFDDDSCD